MNNETIYHTSPVEIKEINKFGNFGEFLFFSDDVYEMSACDTLTYSLEIDMDAVIPASSMFYIDDSDKICADEIDRVCEMFDVDSDTAINLLDESETMEMDAEDSWYLQRLTADCAKKLGFAGVIVTDEQGTSYMIDMLNKCEFLKKVK